MKGSKLWRWIGVIILGALGSAAWELAVRPMGGMTIKLTLNIVTLGIDSLRDGLYADAARGATERVGALTLTILCSVLMTVAGGSVGFRYGRRKTNVKKIEGKSIDELSVEIQRYDRLMFGLQIFVTILIITLYFIAQRAIYVNGVTSYFERIQASSAPYMSENDRLKIRSAFHLVKSRADYLELVSRLQDVTKINGIELPPFEVY